MGDERVLSTFLDLCRIYSPTLREADVAAYVTPRLKAAGLSVRFDGSAATTGSNTGNLIATLPATAPGLHLVLSAHMDCVEPCEGVEPVVRDGEVFSAGETILGADDKCGIAAIIETVERIAEESRPHSEITVVLTVGEEKGLMGAKALDVEDARGDLCLVLDADGSVGGIVTGAPTHYTFTATFRGRASHAGVAPEKGRSAIRMAADAIARMELGRLDEHTTANIGTINGGSATNVIAPTVIVTGECRSLDADRAEEVREAMDAAMRRGAEAEEGSVEVAWVKEYEGFCFPDDDSRVRLVEDACRDIEVEPRLFATGGGSDGNVFSAKGVPTLVLSSGMSGVHGVDECIALEDLRGLPELLLAVVARAVA